MSIAVIKPGLQSSFQDRGRYGYQHLGVPVSGAMDTRAHRLANLLAGNTGDQASLEITLNGPTLQFDDTACIAISGALLSPAINDQPVPNNRPLIVRRGDTLRFGEPQHGLRAYLAVYGGFDIDSVMDSQSTYLRGQLGGWQGRSLQKGDVIPLRTPLHYGQSDALAQRLWEMRIYLPAILGPARRDTVRVMRGQHAALFTDTAIDAFFKKSFRIQAQSDRMGYRLEGPALSMKTPRQLLSEATSFGTIQVPASGQPIILMADRQTTGGYAKLAHICTVDLTIVAQRAPGEWLGFREISVAIAQQLDSQREEAFGRLERSLDALHQLLADTQRNSP